MSKLFVLAAYFWSFVQGLRALKRFSGINDAKFSNVYLSATVAPFLLLAGLHSGSSAAWLIGAFFYPVMPLLAMGVFFATFKVLHKLAATDGKPLKEDHEAPKCCSAICTDCAVKVKECADLECCSTCLSRCSELCTQCSLRCNACSLSCQPLSLGCNGFWLQLTTCLVTGLDGLSKCLQACCSPFEKLPGCEGIADLPKLIVTDLKRGMLSWLAESAETPLMRFVALVSYFPAIQQLTKCSVNPRISILATICFILIPLVRHGPPSFLSSHDTI